MQTKTCTKCGEEKALTEFHKKKTGKYGVTSQCKECIREIDREYNRRPEVKKREKARSISPKRQAYRREYNQRPEVKARSRKRSMSPERREYMREYNQRPEVKERKLEYSRSPHGRERNSENGKSAYRMGLKSNRHVEIADKHANRSGKWSDSEIKFLMDSDLLLTDIALKLGRSYQSVRSKRQRLRKLQEQER